MPGAYQDHADRQARCHPRLDGENWRWGNVAGDLFDRRIRRPRTGERLVLAVLPALLHESKKTGREAIGGAVCAAVPPGKLSLPGKTSVGLGYSDVLGFQAGKEKPETAVIEREDDRDTKTP